MAGVWPPGHSAARLSVPDDTLRNVSRPASSASLALCPAHPPCCPRRRLQRGAPWEGPKRANACSGGFCRPALSHPLPQHGVETDSGSLVHRRKVVLQSLVGRTQKDQKDGEFSVAPLDWPAPRPPTSPEHPSPQGSLQSGSWGGSSWSPDAAGYIGQAPPWPWL